MPAGAAHANSGHLRQSQNRVFTRPRSNFHLPAAQRTSAFRCRSGSKAYVSGVPRGDLPSLHYHARLPTARKVELCKRRFRTLTKAPYHAHARTGRPPSLVPTETSRVSALPARRPRRGSVRADPSCARCFAEDGARAYMNNARFRRTPYSASGFVVPSPTLSTMAAKARSRRFGNRARSAAAWAAGISSRVRSVQ
jgi:hypothetical protein